jgi:hypothetical protein
MQIALHDIVQNEQSAVAEVEYGIASHLRRQIHRRPEVQRTIQSGEIEQVLAGLKSVIVSLPASAAKMKRSAPPSGARRWLIEDRVSRQVHLSSMTKAVVAELLHGDEYT